MRRHKQGLPIVKALVGGTLIDGYGSTPIRNSVVIIEGERIKAVGQVGTLAIPPGAEVISTEGMSVLPGLWDMHVHLHDQRSLATTPTGTRPIRRRWRSVIMPASREAAIDGRRHERARSRWAAESRASPFASASTKARFLVQRCTSRVRSFSTSRIPAPSMCRWGVNGADDARAKVRKLAEAGVDVIKLIDQDQMTMEEVQRRRRRGAQTQRRSSLTRIGRKRFAAACRPASIASSTLGSPPRPSIRPTSSR